MFNGIETKKIVDSYLDSFIEIVSYLKILQITRLESGIFSEKN